MSKLWKVACVVSLVVLLAACGPEQPTATVTAEPGDVQGAGEQPPEATQEPTEEPTQAVTVTVSQDTNCRKGPGGNFDLVYIFKAGESAEVLGVDASGEYYVVDNPNDGECWLWNGNATTEGNSSDVQVRASPPTPTAVPAPNWSGTWHIWMTFTGPNDVRETNIQIIQTGQDFYTQFTLSSIVFTYYGTVRDDGMLASGYFTVSTMPPGNTYPFTFARNLNNLNQFTGIWKVVGGSGIDGDFCGSKGGEPKPDPCRLVSP